jgi:pre-rRNA-processing protein TSR3
MADIRLYAIMEREDDPKKCTAARLVRAGELREVRGSSGPPRGAVVLDPEAETAISREDRDAASKFGILVLDCSWNRLRKFPMIRSGLRHRALPFVLAANPTNFGKAQRLSSAEALAASLYIIGEKVRAEKLMSRFKWGSTFIDINRELLDQYAAAETSSEVVRAQNDVLRSLDVAAKDER